MNRVSLLLQTPAVSLWEFDHPPGEHSDPERETAREDSISFVDAGSFDIRLGAGSWTLRPGDVFVTSQGMEFSCTHDCDMPTDRCFTVSYDARTVDDLRSADIPALRPPLAALSRTQRFIRHRLQSCGEGQEIRFELLAAVLYESMTTSENVTAVGQGNVTPLMRRIDRSIELIETEYGRTLTLGDLAAAAGLSTYHFARAFRSLMGIPPHRYLTAVRLRHAARLLDDGAGVTYTCFEAGFGSLSHFVTAFRKRFGVLPSDVRDGEHVPALRAGLSAPVWIRH
ncbi:MAG: helix-turn-helix transcriptional regulator [Gemmatimonadaceae bacterium]